MPESTVELGNVSQLATPPVDSLSGTNLRSALKTGEAVAAAVVRGGVMGMSERASKVASVPAVALIVTVLLSASGAAFMWLRADTLSERADYRAQVLRAEQQNEDRRREDRADRQRIEELFSRTLETISRDNRESVLQMKIVSEQVKASADQMKAATEAMVRVEKLLTAKMQ